MTRVSGLHDLEISGVVPESGELREARLVTDAIVKPDHVEGDFRHGELFYDTRGILADAPERGLLQGFLLLSDASDADILKFARRYGVLGVEPFDRYGAYSESFEEWRGFARRARATLAIANALRENRETPPEAWQVLESWFIPEWLAIFKANPLIPRAEVHRRAEDAQMNEVLNMWTQ